MNAKNLAIVLIHGIGDITKGSVLNASANAIKDNLSTVSLSEPTSLPPSLPLAHGQGQASITAIDLKWHEQQIRLVEFQWSGIIGKIRLYRPLDAMIKFLTVLLEFPLLGTVGQKSATHRIFVTGFGLIHQFFMLAFLFLLLWVFVAEMQHHEEYAKALQPILEVEPPFETTTTAEWGYQFGDIVLQIYNSHTYMAKSAFTKSLIVIPLYCFIVIPLFLLISIVNILGHFRVTNTASTSLGVALSALLMFIAWLGLIISAIFLFELILSIFIDSPTGLGGLIFTFIIFLFIGWLLLKVATILANLLRDIVHYLAPAANGKPQVHQENIRLELENLLQRLGEDGVDRIILVTHSLGTIIAADMLLKADTGENDKHSIPVDLITAGSPLARLINRLLPQRMPKPLQLRQQLAVNKVYPVLRWFNFYRLFDYVGQALTYSALLLDLFPLNRKLAEPEFAIQDNLLKPRYIWPLGHANYWDDKRFLDLIVNNVFLTVFRESSKD